MAQSQLELLANSLSSPRNNNPSKPQSKVQSMILYLPAENVLTGQLEFTPAVLYPDPSTERVFIASDAASGQAPTLPKTLTKLPGFSHASTLLPGYPLLSSQPQTPGVGAVEEVLCDIRFKTSALSVPLLSGSQTVGVLLVSPAVSTSINGVEVFEWTVQDRQQVSRAAQSLSMALMMDSERNILREQNALFRESLSDSLHQVKNPIQALRTYGKILQRQIADASKAGNVDDKSGTPQLLELAERLMVQSERVVDLLRPMDSLMDSFDQPMVLLPPAQNDTSMVLWHQAQQAPSMQQTMRATNTTATFQPSTVSLYPTNGAADSTLVGDFGIEMTFVTDVVEPVLETFRAIASEQKIAFDVIVDNADELPGVMAAPKSFQEAVSNVLDNAIKYAVLPKAGSPFTRNPSPSVRVRLYPNDDTEMAGVTVMVEDNGPGINESDKEHIFRRGFRGEQTAKVVDGRGIGLDISKALMKRMGGNLDLATQQDKFGDSLDGAAMKLILFRKPK
jgi:signal transduction histidine kinase